MGVKLDLSPRRKIKDRAVCKIALMRTFGPIERKQEGDNNCVVRSFIICALH
jgi:hypothetical protein